MTRYQDFDVFIDPSSKGYRVHVSSLTGQASAKISPRDAEKIEALRAEFSRLSLLRADELIALRHAQELGGALYKALFENECGRVFAASLERASGQGAGLRIRLRLARAPKLTPVPWELLYDPADDNFLALSAETPIVRQLDLSRGPRPFEVQLPLSMLVVVASPIDRPPLRADRELERIRTAISPLAKTELIRLEPLGSATFLGLAERLQKEDIHVLHFIGHGAFDGERREGALAFEDVRRMADPVSASRLAALLRDHPSLRLVFLNACEGALSDEYDAFGGVAQKLLQRQIPAVVAMQREITNRAATLFSQSFYSSLTAGAPVDGAVTEGRKAVYLEARDSQWVAPVLYLRAPDGVLFKLPGQGEPAVEAPPRWRWIAAGLLLVVLAYFFLLRGSNGRPRVGVKIPASPSCPSPDSPEILFVPISAGSFEMGSFHGGKSDERPVHQVTISHPFCIGAYETTVGQWEAVMGDREAKTSRENTMPKTEVSWDDTQTFFERLNTKKPGRHFRLPTEAQWEYAGRAGSAASYSFGDDPSRLREYGNCMNPWLPGDGYEGLAPIGVFSPNKWWVFDMQGNVWEWVADFYGPYDVAPTVDPTGPVTGDKHVRRGGSYKSRPESCRITTRAGSAPSYRHLDGGFRIAADPVK